MDIAPRPLAQELLQLAEGGAHGRANRGAGGKDEVDHHDLAAHEIAIEVDRSTVLIDEGDVRNLEIGDVELVRCAGLGSGGRGRSGLLGDGEARESKSRAEQNQAPEWTELLHQEYLRANSNLHVAQPFEAGLQKLGHQP